MIVTDKVQVENGEDYSFVCKKIPFAISCSSDFVNKGCNLIDLDLVNKMQLKLRDIKVCRMTIHGQNMRSVGYVKQSIQCVQAGKIIGTVHLTAKVIRDLYNLFNMDCVASANTYTRLTGHDPPPDDDHHDEEVSLNIPSLGGDLDDLDKGKATYNIPVCSNESDDSDIDDPGDDDTTLNQGKADSKVKDDVVDAVLNYLSTLHQPTDQSPSLFRPLSNNSSVSQNHVICQPPDDEVNSMTQADNQQDEVCDLCYKENLPPEIFLSHPTLHPRCLSISELDKRRMYGHKWRTML